MNSEKIEKIFFLLCGEIPEQTEEKRLEIAKMLCRDAQNSIFSELREDIQAYEIEDNEERLNIFAAASAFYTLMLLDEANLPESITTNEIKVISREKSKKAAVILEEKRSAVAALFKNKDFYFGAVRG